MTVSYEQLLKDYLDSPSESYEQEYPEFPLIKRYLKESEMNTLRWNREKMLKAVEDKKQVDKVFLAIYQPGFISNTQSYPDRELYSLQCGEGKQEDRWKNC
ncbi:hypothetical protein [Bacteroides xylanisolvens]|uniref:hypothetical protein n=1 Tax=Bacteroides xylanisolvens TaxID=371601 RepID=UPI0022E7DEB7|nr:hypothetical protein [Bacteroides xylanisolvens]